MWSQGIDGRHHLQYPSDSSQSIQARFGLRNVTSADTTDPELNRQNFFTVFRAIKERSAHWEVIGKGLGHKENFIEGLKQRSSYVGDPLATVLYKSMESCVGNTKADIIAAVQQLGFDDIIPNVTDAFGQSDKLSGQNINCVYNALSKRPDSWYSIGAQMGLDENFLECLKTNQNPSDCESHIESILSKSQESHVGHTKGKIVSTLHELGLDEIVPAVEKAFEKK